ncbi:ATP-dependent helicase [Desulfotalea psychrophila]|uniref:DNA 3'-5' helicase n=1 Tax=Desulfotalea psychrophila (strain LSv54 / DSM 12343) TaxID=177439 RepID=Q6AJ72_DESPS|nr:ATP-dependent helicase [Desulfotalea psychrophila]CAG37608.1 Probable ATP-dependent DNA helicase, UvrD/REP family [Desulfotalea psychrophila LSv54]
MNIDKTNFATADPSPIDLSGLNPAQHLAVTTTEGPVLVIAGAGSGKTRTLIYRVAHLLDKGVAPESILLLTFTRKASQEMVWRAGELLGENCSRVMGGTFHGVANMLLRQYGSHMGWGKGFTIIDRADAEGIINLLKSSLEMGKGDKRFPGKRIIINIISGSINKSTPMEELIHDQYGHLADHCADILRLGRHYHTFKRDNVLMDYDDLLVNWKLLLQESPEVRSMMSHRFRYVMVDEYQDTNLIQADIIRLLASEHSNVMVVGDDSQSIYSFRGADFYNIMRFPKEFPGAKLIKLEENYRSTQPILSLTNDLIANASEKYTKSLHSNIKGEQRPIVYGARDEQAEATFILARVQQHIRDGIDPSEIAVLFRSGFHSYKLEIGLGAAGIEFEKRGGLKLTEAAHMKDVLSFLRLLVNPRDNLSWNRVLLQLDRIGPKTAQKITTTIVPTFDPFLSLKNYPASKASVDIIAGLADLFRELRVTERTPAALYELVLNYYTPLFERLYSDDYPKREKDLEHFKGVIAGYDDLQKFIDDTTLDPPAPTADKTPDGKRMVLSTIHSSKGLEFDAVFVMGLAEGRFPHANTVGFGPQWEEERRLLYVAATRARKHLYLTYPRQMMTPDRQFKRVGMSPYLVELKDMLYERVEGSSTSSLSRPSRFAESNSPRPVGIPAGRRSRPAGLKRADLSLGTRVKHPFFGEGTVKKMPGGPAIEVEFEQYGTKALHLDYAKLELV